MKYTLIMKFNKAKKIAEILKKKYKIGNIDYVIVAGSGLLDAVVDLEDITIVPYDKIRMPKSRVSGHSGKFIFGKYCGKNVAIVSRVHYYEYGDMNKVRLPYEVLSYLDTKKVILLTASGGINKTFRVGDIMLISDHINFTGQNPLVAIKDLKFTSMTNAYDKDMFNKMAQIADENDINVRQGVHIQFLGPSYETMAEIAFAKSIGADSVSMSTVFDCIICNYLGMKVAGIASIVNVFSGNDESLDHKKVLDDAQKTCQKIKIILSELLKE